MKKLFIFFLMFIFIYSCNSIKKSDYQEKQYIKEQEDSIKQLYFEDSLEYSYMLEKRELSETYKESEMIEISEMKKEPTIEKSYNKEDKTYGSLFYRIDTIFVIDKVSRVEAKIIKKITDDKETKYIIKTFKETNNSEVKKNTIEVSNVMDMELFSLEPDAFVINKISSDSQIVDDDDVTEWIWGVKPTKPGNYNLILKAIIKENNSSKDKIVFDEIINVKNRPKKKYVIQSNIPKEIKRYEDINIEIKISENKYDSYNFKWNGYGKIKIEFNGNVEIINLDDNYELNNNKSIYYFNWNIRPLDKNNVSYKVKLIGNKEDIIIYEDDITINNNIKETLSIFIDKVLKRWYWLFTTLLIPLYKFIQNKFFKKKDKK